MAIFKILLQTRLSPHAGDEDGFIVGEAEDGVKKMLGVDMGEHLALVFFDVA